MSSPYTPPGTPVRDPAPARGSAWKAVLAGIAVDTGGNVVASIALLLTYGAMLMASGVEDPVELQKAIMYVARDSWVGILALLFNGALSLAGGYACARIARHAEYGLGAIVAVFGVVAGLVFSLANYPAGQHLVLNIAGMAFVFAGVWIGRRRNARG